MLKGVRIALPGPEVVRLRRSRPEPHAWDVCQAFGHSPGGRVATAIGPIGQPLELQCVGYCERCGAAWVHGPG